MRILVCGGRDFCDESLVARWLGPFKHCDTLLIQGGARGADFLAKKWAEANGVHQAGVPANWGAHGMRAGPLRNSAMLLLQPDLCIAFPGGRGTADMIRKCESRNILTVEVTT